jgi:uncharacterized protein YyaL (SSP411 family)
MTENEAWSERGGELLRTMARTMREHPLAAGRYLSATDFYLGPIKEVALSGKRESDDLQALLDATYAQFEPNTIVGHVGSRRSRLIKQMPFLQDRPARNGLATAYVCEHFACLPPVHEPEALVRQLAEGTGVAWRDF